MSNWVACAVARKRGCEATFMHIGVNTGILTWNRGTLGIYASIAKEADELGFESLWGGHHIVFSSELERRPSPQNATGARADPWVLYAYLSALTTRLRFGTGIYQLPLVNPFLT